MRAFLRGALSALFLCHVAAAAPAQVIQQSGPLILGHALQSFGNGYAGDAGGPLGYGLAPVNPNTNSLPLGYAWQNPGLADCGFSANSSGPYSSLCWGFDGNGNAEISATSPTLTFVIGGQTVVLPGAINPAPRITITQPTTFYVNPNSSNSPCGGGTCGPGSDNNPGTQARPWQHLQFAADNVALNYNIGARTIIQLADGTYPESVWLPNWSGTFQRYDTLSNAFSQTNGEPIIEGHSGSIGSVVIAGSSGDFTLGGVYSEWLINDLTVSNVNGASYGIGLDWNSTLDLGNIAFTGFSAEGISVRYNSTLEILGGAAITISGSMPTFAIANENGIILAHNPGSVDVTISLFGTPAFADGFIRSDQTSSTVDFFAVGFSGSATGLQYQIGDASAYGFSGVTPPWFPNLPGSSAGAIVGPKVISSGTYYVNSSASTSPCGIETCNPGSDVTGNGTYQNPWASAQHGVSWILANVDTLGANPVLQLADGTYTGSSLSAPLAGGGALEIIGDASTPTNVVVNGGASPCFSAYGAALLHVSYVECTSTGSDGLLVSENAQMWIDGAIIFGAVNSDDLLGQSGGRFHLNAGFNIDNSAASAIVLQNAYADVTAVMTVSLPNNVTFASGFIDVSDGGVAAINSGNLTFSVVGTVTAQRYFVNTGGVIDTNGGGATYFPGNSAGSTDCAVTAGSIGTGSIGTCGEYY